MLAHVWLHPLTAGTGGYKASRHSGQEGAGISPAAATGHPRAHSKATNGLWSRSTDVEPQGLGI